MWERNRKNVEGISYTGCIFLKRQLYKKRERKEEIRYRENKEGDKERRKKRRRS